MNTKELLQYHKEFSDRARNIMATKNHDYSGHSGTTPFKNFEVVETLGIASTGQGFMVRMLDKFMRLSTFVVSGTLKVKNEGFEDACLDIANYCILLAAWYKSKNKMDK